MTTYTVECTPTNGVRHTLRVRGYSEAVALMGAYDYLVRQWDGLGEIHEDTLTEVTE